VCESGRKRERETKKGRVRDGESERKSKSERGELRRKKDGER
jgi:hypothetical protein